MGVQFTWDESYTVGREDIDAQHKHMFEIANSLPETLDEPHLKRAVVALIKHTREHFDAEEKMMSDIGYPKLQQHRLLHEDLIEQLHRINIMSFNEQKMFTAFKLHVYNWVIDHIMNHDKDYFRFTREGGGKQ